MPFRGGAQREPIFNLPPVVAALVALLVVIHCARLLLPDALDEEVLGLFAFAPGRYFGEPPGYAPWPGGLAAQIWSPFTYALLHNDFLHLISNGVVLAALGNLLARRTTAMRFLVFVVVTAPLSALGELAIAPFQSAPVIGISGVICALLGGFARVMFPREIEVEVAHEENPWLQPADAGAGVAANGAMPDHPVARRIRRRGAPVAGPILETLMRPQVIRFILAFAILNLVLVFGAPVLMGGSGGAGVAWMVHVAGFIAGFFLWPRFDLVRA